MKTLTNSRDYPALVERVRSVQARGWDVREAGKVCEMPLLSAERSSGGDHPLVLLVGGIHGDEPAGVEAAVSWMESGLADRWPIDWLVLPCANPNLSPTFATRFDFRLFSWVCGPGRRINTRCRFQKCV